MRWLVLVACVCSVSAAEDNITYSPLGRSEVAAAYGKLPKTVQVWAVGCRGPLDLDEVRRFMVMAGYPVLMRSHVDALGLRAQRTSWLTIIPEAVSFGTWALPYAFERTALKVAVPVAVDAGAELVKRLPTGAAREKYVRALADACNFSLSVKAGQNHDCAIFTMLPAGRKPEPFRIIVPARGGSIE